MPCCGGILTAFLVSLSLSQSKLDLIAYAGRFLNLVVESDRPAVIQCLNAVTSVLKGMLDRL